MEKANNWNCSIFRETLHMYIGKWLKVLFQPSLSSSFCSPELVPFFFGGSLR